MPIEVARIGGEKRNWSTHIQVDVSNEVAEDLRRAVRESKADILFVDYCGMDLPNGTTYAIYYSLFLNWYFYFQNIHIQCLI